MTLVGAAFGGVLLALWHDEDPFLAALLVAVTNLLFAWQAVIGYNVPLTFAISVDNFSAGIWRLYRLSIESHGNGYSATQYALLSSIMVLFPKVYRGLSGVYVDAFGYVNFFVAASVIGFPVLFWLS